MGRMSGTFGTAVLSQTQDGTVMRARPAGNPHRSAGQRAQDARMIFANRMWQTMTFEQATAWRSYALSLATRNPATGGLRMPAAYRLFTGYSTKYLQIHGGVEAPGLPPSGRFNGDVVNVSLEGGSNEVVLVADRANLPGVLTEIKGQRVKNPNNLPKAKSYVTLGFVSFEAGVPVSIPVGLPGTWVFAIGFVEASSGRMTEAAEIGRAAITGEWI